MEACGGTDGMGGETLTAAAISGACSGKLYRMAF